MASSGVANELNAQLEKRNKSNTSEAEKIISADSSKEEKKDEASGGSRKKKSKGGIFGKFKKLVKRPGQKKSDEQGHAENGHKLRTKSTSDLTEENEGGKGASPEHGSKHKHGISSFFERKIKGRSSWKPKSKKGDSSSEPVSPEHSVSSGASQVPALGEKEREELEKINKTIADDSFFQVSLTANNQDASILKEISTPLDDFGIMSESSPGIGQQSVAQDRIRLAPKGRRRPNRFNSGSDMKGANAQEKGNSDKPSKVENKDKLAVVDKKENAKAEKMEKSVMIERGNKTSAQAENDKTKKPEVPQKPRKMNNSGNSGKINNPEKDEKIIKTETGSKVDGSPSYSEKKEKDDRDKSLDLSKKSDSPFVPLLDISLNDNSMKLDLSDAVIIQTPKDPSSTANPQSASTPIKDDFGSWEHLTGAKVGTELQKNEPHSNENRNGSNLIPESRRIGDSKKSNSLKFVEFEKPKKLVVSDKSEVKRNPIEEGKAQESSKEQDILDLIEGKVVDAEEKDKTGKEKKVKESDVNAKGDNNSSSPGDSSSAFDALVSRTRRLSEEQQKKPNENNKNESKANTKSVEFAKTSKKNFSFDLNDMDDMRSSDLQPMSFQRSYSMSAVVKDKSQSVSSANGPELSKWNSLDDSVTREEKTEGRKTSQSTENEKAPDWVAIAKAKHQRNTSEDEETLEETMEEIMDIAAQMAKPNLNKSPPPMKEKPIIASSKIPKPSFKSQSMKAPSPSATQGSSVQPRHSVSSKVSSPASSCLVCSKPAYQFERCDVDGKVIHKTCARCSMCSRTMTVGTIRVINDKLYCGIHARTPVS